MSVAGDKKTMVVLDEGLRVCSLQVRIKFELYPITIDSM